MHVYCYFRCGRECSSPSYASIQYIGGKTNILGDLSVRATWNPP